MTLEREHHVLSRLAVPLNGPLHLVWTLESGQAFRWRPASDAYSGTIGPHVYVLRHVIPTGEGENLIPVRPAEGPRSIGEPVEGPNGRPTPALPTSPPATSTGDALHVETTAPSDAAAAALRRYLRLDDDLDAVHAALASDPVLAPLLARWRGLRLLQVPPWECLVGFVCSTQNNVRRISGIMERLSVAFGVPVTLGDITRHTFPSAPALAEAGEEAMRKLGLGYRAPFVAHTASLVARGKLDLDEVVLRLPYAEARRRLLDLHGVGEKVADCVLLYAGRHGEAFPVDRWVRRALDRWYVGGRGFKRYEEYRAWAVAHFGLYAGYAQQYLFQELRMEERRATA